MKTVEAIEVLRQADGPEDVPFLSIRRQWARNLRRDGSHSKEYRVDTVDRSGLDAVAVLLWRRGANTVEVLTRSVLRPAAYFRRFSGLPAHDAPLYFEEIVAGLIEADDHGRSGILRRAQIEIQEEAGISIGISQIHFLGPSLFVAPGILSERIHLTVADVTGCVEGIPLGDGSPLEEGALVRWRGVSELSAALHSGEIIDAKTEIAFLRFLALHR